MKISVITICFNSGKYLERAINSVLLQEYKNWEHIVVDGGSEDETLNILDNHKHLKWISEPDKGQSDAMNKGFIRSTGDLILYLNADDELNPGLFRFVIDHFKKHSATDMLVMNLRSINAGVETISKPSTFLEEILRYNPCRFPLNPISYVYRRTLQNKVGSFPVHYHYAMDYWFIIRAYAYGNIQYGDFLSGTFYFDGNNKSADWEKSCRHMKEIRDRFLFHFFYKKPVMKFNFNFFIYKLHLFLLKHKLVKA